MELKIEYMALDKLKPYEKNARKHQEQGLVYKGKSRKSY